MNKEDLLARRQQAEAMFNETAKQKEQKLKEVEEIDLEMARLQGEWRLLGEQLDSVESPKEKKASRAEVIDVTTVKGA